MSSENENKNSPSEEIPLEGSQEANSAQSNNVEELKGNEAPSLADQLEKVTKDSLYLRAEFENYKRNAIKERVALQKFGAQRLALDLLPVLDVFSQALAEVKDEQSEDPFIKGIQMTHKELIQSLEKHGIVEVKAIGEAFNPEVHEALGTEPTDQHDEGKICRVFKAPFKYHEKLLRAGQVFVAIPLKNESV